MKQPIKTIDAKCKDCHRCIRACPVKAISLRHGQAQVVYDRCITCGLCVSACPQKAKTVNSRVDDVSAWLKDGYPVVVSLAPTFPAAFTQLEPLQVIAGLEAVGFMAVEETATAAADIARHYHKSFNDLTTPTISSCCPVVVNLIEMYYPQLVHLLASPVSPMIWHSHTLRRKYGDAKIVFIGPCAAKIQEATRVPSHVDAVLTFRQLSKMWQNLNLNVAELTPAKPIQPVNAPRLYPLSRGILASSILPEDTSHDVVSVSGIETCMATFRDMGRGLINPQFVEALACREGCIGGAGMPCGAGLIARRAAVIRYHQSCLSTSPAAVCNTEATPHGDIPSVKYHARLPDYRQPSDDEILSILSQIGKHEPEDQRNCGGCGYTSCRQKAIATFQGLAELEMCVPFMKAKFESLSHLVVESSMDGVIVVNKDMTIHQLNPSAQRMFNPQTLPTTGKHLAAFVDPSDFMEVASTGSVVHRRVDYPSFGLVTSQVIYSLPEYSLVVGIVTDVTEVETRKKRLDAKHQATIQRATAVIKNQMKLAQEIASLLGESTAETKSTLLDLISTLTEDGDNVCD